MSWAVRIRDDFNRADGTLVPANGWSDFSSNGVGPGTMGGAPMAVASNHVAINNSGFDGAAIYTGRGWANDQYASCALTETSGGTVGSGQGLLVRASFPGAVGQGYRLVVLGGASNPNVELARFSGGSYVMLEQVRTTHTDGDVYTLRAVGQGQQTVLEVLRNGTVIQSYNDNNPAALNSGWPGVAYSSTLVNSYGDDFEAGEWEGLGATAPTTPILDPFERANQDPISGLGWKSPIAPGTTGLRILSNVLAGNAADDTHSYYDVPFSADQEVYGTITTLTNGRNIYLFCRLQAPGTAGVDGYYISWEGGGGGPIFMGLYRLDNGSGTSLDSINLDAASKAVSNGDKMWLRAVGTTLAGYIYRAADGAWTQMVGATDSTYPRGGYLGVG